MVKALLDYLLKVAHYPDNFLVGILYLNYLDKRFLAFCNLYFNKNHNFYFFEIINYPIYQTHYFEMKHMPTDLIDHHFYLILFLNNNHFNSLS